MTKKDQDLINRIADGARTGRISRRDFMSYSAAAGLATAGATSLWTTSARAQAQRGGTFRWGIHDGNTGDTHDPGSYVTRTMIFLAHTHRSYLTMINGDGSLGPDIADSWAANEAASEWTFELEPERLVPPRQARYGGRRDRVAQPPPRRENDLGGQGAAEGCHRHHRRRRSYRHSDSRRRQCRLPLADDRLSPGDLPGQRRRHARLAIGRRLRPVQDRSTASSACSSRSAATTAGTGRRLFRQGRDDHAQRPQRAPDRAGHRRCGCGHASSS